MGPAHMGPAHMGQYGPLWARPFAARSLPFRFMSYLAWTCIEVVHLCILPTLLSLELSAPTVYSDLLLEQQA